MIENSKHYIYIEVSLFETLIYLLAELGLSCGVWDLGCMMWYLLVVVHGLSSCDTQALQLWHTGSRMSGLVNCSPEAHSLHGSGTVVARAGMGLASPALQGGLLASGPPGKSLEISLAP